MVRLSKDFDKDGMRMEFLLITTSHENTVKNFYVPIHFPFFY